MAPVTNSRVHRPVPRPYAEYDLVCLSFCGGGTAAFRRWASRLDDHAELCLVCYPGRESRFTEPFARDWDELLDDVTELVTAAVRRPYVLFGHSMGASVAFETVRRFAAHGTRLPELLVVSGSDTPAHRSARTPGRPRATGTDEELLRWASAFGQLPAEVLAEPDLRDMTVELLRADLTVMDSYHPDPEARVDVPIEVLYGENDEGDAEAIHQRWAALTTSRSHGRTLPGGHFYTSEVWDRIPDYLSAFSRAG